MRQKTHCDESLVFENAGHFHDYIMQNLSESTERHVDDNFDFSVFNLTQKEEFLKTTSGYVQFFTENSNELFETYLILSNSTSRELFINLILYRMAGPDHIRIQENWTYSKLQEFDQKLLQYHAGPSSLDFEKHGKILQNFADVPFQNYLMRMDTGLDCRFLFTGQYFYESPEASIKVKHGDIVIDAGSGMGESTVQLALAAGEQGRVYAFDPLPVHHEILEHNLRQNNVSDRVECFQSGLYNSYNAGGELQDTSKVVRPDFILDKNENLPTITLDQFAEDHALKSVDFIKMDIEGSELAALEGASEVIQKYNPKLAISLYHKREDYIDIPRYLVSLCPDYSFFLGHYTIHSSETILYGISSASYR